MKAKEKIETLKHTMDRFDHYFETVNNKGNLLLSLNTFLFGGTVTAFYSIKESVAGRCDVYFFVFTCLLCCLLSICFTLWAIIPFLSKRDSGSASILYFGNVSDSLLNDFKKMYDEMTENSLYDDYLCQVHILAVGLHKKFCRLQVAAYLLAGCFVCIMSGILILI